MSLVFAHICRDYLWIFYTFIAIPFGCAAGAWVAKMTVNALERDMIRSIDERFTKRE